MQGHGKTCTSGNTGCPACGEDVSADAETSTPCARCTKVVYCSHRCLNVDFDSHLHKCPLVLPEALVPAFAGAEALVDRHSPGDAQAVLAVAAVHDPADAYSRPARPFGPDFSAGPFRFGVPRPQDLNFFDNPAAPQLFEQAVRRLESLGGVAVEVDAMFELQP